MPFTCVSSQLNTEKLYDGLHHDILWVSQATSVPPEKTVAHASRKQMMTTITLKDTKTAHLFFKTEALLKVNE